MRFIVFSDLHVHGFRYGATYDTSGINSRLLDGVQVLEQVLERADEIGAAAVLFGGDLFQEMGRVHTAAWNRVADTMSRGHGQPPVHAIAGNHDLIAKRTGESALHALRHVNGVNVYETPTVYCWGEVAVTFIPFLQDPEDLADAVQAAWAGSGIDLNDLDTETHHILLSHNGITEQANALGFTTDDAFSLQDIHDAAPVPDGWSLVLNGHYHKRRTLKLPNGNAAVIIGSTMQHNFGDAGQKHGWLEVEINSANEIIITHRQSDAPKFHILKDGDVTSQVRACDFVRFVGTPSEDLVASGADIASVSPVEASLKDRGNLSLADGDRRLLKGYVALQDGIGKKHAKRLAKMGRDLLCASE